MHAGAPGEPAIENLDPQVLRIIDANYNRTGEALRVVEDYARFALGSSAASQRLKLMRHRLLQAVSSVAPRAVLVSWRDTAGDVGTHISTEFEKTRTGIGDVVAANIRRAQEGLRVLEEYAKTIDPRAAESLEKLRYELYTAEKGLVNEMDPCRRLLDARLYVLVTTSLLRGRKPEEVTRDAIRGGADIIQMREKEMHDGEFLDLARRLREVCRDAGVPFIVNDRAHVAQIVDADGLHVGEDDLPAAEARRLLGAGKIIGVSTHSPEQAQAAIEAGASYIGVGPVNATPTKPTTAPVGLAYVRYAAENVRIPFYAIGGIAPSTAEDILEAGARRLAVCSAIISADDVAAAAACLKSAIARHGT